MSSYQDLIQQQINSLGKLPLPEVEAIQTSERLQQRLLEQYQSSDDGLPFDSFMEQALYAPGLGYYAAGSEKLGQAGDFITAPEISPLFSEALAHQIDQILRHCKDSGCSRCEVLEFGAGRGIMAVDILKRLKEMDALPERYLILEISAELQQRQQQTIASEIPQLADKVQWISQLPETGFEGVMVANEVVDAMPVTVFQKSKGQFIEKKVYWNGHQWELQSAHQENSRLQQWGKSLEQRLGDPLTEDYCSEWNPRQNAWLQSLSECLRQGMILLIDYGFPEKEYYHPQRMGTLMCHYRHYSHENPLVLLGLQDITAHVDFTSLAQTAFDAGLQVHGFTNQANFLTNCGILERMEQLGDIDDAKIARYSQQLKLLMLPSEMGELFKVLALTKDCQNLELLGFQMGDKRSSL